jgi:hypothetical protein
MLCLPSHFFISLSSKHPGLASFVSLEVQFDTSNMLSQLFSTRHRVSQTAEPAWRAQHSGVLVSRKGSLGDDGMDVWMDDDDTDVCVDADDDELETVSHGQMEE